MSIDKVQEAINIGKRAEALLHDELFLAVLDTLRRDLIEEWEVSKGNGVNDVMIREDIRRQVILIGRIRTKLEALKRNGRVAQQKLN